MGKRIGPLSDWIRRRCGGQATEKDGLSDTGQRKEDTKKKMVPSDLSNNSTSFRHARLKLCNPGARSHCPFAPRPGISSATDQHSKARQSAHTESEPAPRNDLSLSLKDCPLPDHLSKVNVPGLSLRIRLKVFPEPVRSNCSSTLPGLPPVARILHSQTRCPVPSSRPQPFFRSSLPFRAFWPFPIKASTRIPAERLTKSKRPIVLRSPPPAFLRRTSSGSMFRTRSVPFGLLSNKPLGTFFTMLPNLFGVN